MIDIALTRYPFRNRYQIEGQTVHGATDHVVEIPGLDLDIFPALIVILIRRNLWNWKIDVRLFTTLLRLSSYERILYIGARAIPIPNYYNLPEFYAQERIKTIF